MGQFGLSQPLRRREDQRLLVGAGDFGDDQNLADQAYAYMLRSPHGHARITRLDTTVASQLPGVLDIYTAADIQQAELTALPCLVKDKLGKDFYCLEQPLLAADEVRFTGDGIAFIVAQTLQQARDAAELIELNFAMLPAVADCQHAQDVSFTFNAGDEAATTAAFAAAHQVIQFSEVNNRVVVNALEPRCALASYDSQTGKYTLRTGTQMPNGVRDQLATVLKVAAKQVRVLVNDVGGSFGAKNSLYPEQALVAFAAKQLGRPVKWVSDRSEAFTSDYHARDNYSEAELAVDEQGKFLALRVTTVANLGAYAAGRGPLSPINIHMASNTYLIPALAITVNGVYTHTTPTDVYRGAGRPEITYLIERLVDFAAIELKIDRVELRRRNLIPVSAFPYQTPTGLSYDLCHFEQLMDEALKDTKWHDFANRRKQAQQRGKLRGIGMANYVERCGGGGGLAESAQLRFAADGSVELVVGAMSNGQGHETAYSQIIHERFALPFEKIKITQGDTDQVETSNGTGGSWSIPMAGGAAWFAADQVITKAKHIAAHLLEASVVDIEFDEGQFSVAGTDLSVDWASICRAAFDQNTLPANIALGLTGEALYQPSNHTFPYGCHICEVEVDPETGAVDIIDYTAVHDFGRALNPLLLAGQVHGGVSQGIGQALLEHTVYDNDTGQLLSGSFMDYGIPRADDLPLFGFQHRATPAASNPMGIKGCGEAGATGSPPALMNAIIDALAPLGVRHVDMPATPERLWRMCQRAEKI